MSPTQPNRWQRTMSRVFFRVGRRVGARLPRFVSRNLEDRVFYVIFNLTRVTNDAYGWRPPEDEVNDASEEGR